MPPIPVIDIFAGPGGLSEGFASFRRNGKQVFDLRLSVENNREAHATLRLRSFFRKFPDGAAPPEYYHYLRDPSAMPMSELFSIFPSEASAAEMEAIRATLGAQADEKRVFRAIASVLKLAGRRPWVLIGGPPCQAYSTVGRSRMKTTMAEHFDTDQRHVLYQCYLGIIGRFLPAVFIMENVKGLLSSRYRGQGIFRQIVADLTEPRRGLRYRLFPLATTGKRTSLLPLSDAVSISEPENFVIRSEAHGIPQLRHRVIIIGIHEELLPGKASYSPPVLREGTGLVTVRSVLHDLPRLRSGLSRLEDSTENWEGVLRSFDFSIFNGCRGEAELKRMRSVIRTLTTPRAGRGSRFVTVHNSSPEAYGSWFLDSRLMGVCNHETRLHMESDLFRYLWASCFGAEHGRTPMLRDFPEDLLPHHRSVAKSIASGSGWFHDRFRVQVWDRPATTITSHLAKDGHAFIHPDPCQCRSLTVREAARLQTFPDNYFFEGSRTQQYRQVGNAVPPLLARQIAVLVSGLDEFKRS